MKVHEYQAKELLAEHGVPVPRGGVATTAAEARKIAGGLGNKVVVKAQLSAEGVVCATGEIVTVQMPESMIQR